MFFYCFLGPKIRPALPFQCEKCCRSYKNKETLTRHLKYECEVGPSFPCVLCDYRAKIKGSLRDHLMAVHNVDRSQFSAFGSAGQLLSPLNLFFGVILSTCMIIHFFSTAPQTRSVQHYICEKCGRTYKNKRSLKRHLTYECDGNPSFSCTQCNYRASHKIHLKRHLINVHPSNGLSQLEA